QMQGHFAMGSDWRRTEGPGVDASGSKVTIRLGNEDFTVRRELWPVGKLRLDPGNQRLQYALRKFGLAATDEELHDMLWGLDQVKALYLSVLQNGGLIEDPIVKEDGTVVERNCRTVV